MPFVFAVATSAAAQNTCNAAPTGDILNGRLTGLSIPFVLFDFTSGLTNGSTAGAFSNGSYTVTTSSLYLGHPGITPYDPSPFSSDALFNFNNTGAASGLVSLSFNSFMIGAAFNFALIGSATISILNSGVTVGSFAALPGGAPAVTSVLCWWGFQLTSGSFDQLNIQTSLHSSLAIDNLELAKLPTSTVPEPSTIALMGLGLAGLGIAARKRARRRKDDC